MADSISASDGFRIERTFMRHDPDVRGMVTHVRTQTARVGTLGSFQYSAFVPFGTPVFYGSQDQNAVQSTLEPYGVKGLERSPLAGADYGRDGR